MPANAEHSVVDTLSPPIRMALAHAPRGARGPTAALFALDARLAGIVRASREPMLAQLRLAWWREQLGAATWPAGEPLLSELEHWRGQHAGLGALVDGWEQLIGEAPLGEDCFTAFAQGRAAAFAALADLLGAPASAPEVQRAVREWALADLSARLGDPREREAIARLIARESWAPARLPRGMRPLMVLHGLARREIRGGQPGLAAIGTALRIGLIGR